MALTAVMKLFCVYLAPYSLFFRTARTVQTTQEDSEKRGSFLCSAAPFWLSCSITVPECDVRYLQKSITFHLDGLSFCQNLLCCPYENKWIKSEIKHDSETLKPIRMFGLTRHEHVLASETEYSEISHHVVKKGWTFLMCYLREVWWLLQRQTTRLQPMEGHPMVISGGHPYCFRR